MLTFQGVEMTGLFSIYTDGTYNDSAVSLCVQLSQDEVSQGRIQEKQKGGAS